MEARSALALMCALLASGVSAGTLAVLAFEKAQSHVGNLRLGKDDDGSLEERALALRSVIEKRLERVPKLAKLLREARAAGKRRQIRKSLPEVIRLLCISLDSGSSLSKALEYAAENCDGAMAKELKMAVWGMHAGQSFEEVMERLRARTGGGEFACLSVAMEIQYRCGGTMTAILEETSSMLQQVSDLEDELVTKTTQAQLSARVVALMPLFVLALLSVVSPGYLSQFTDSAAGVGMLVFAVVLELAGVVMVRKSLKVDVGMGEE